MLIKDFVAVVTVDLIDYFTGQNLPTSSFSSLETVMNVRPFSVTAVSPGHYNIGFSHPSSVGVSEECKPK